jgi:hypothetical protein
MVFTKSMTGFVILLSLPEMFARPERSRPITGALRRPSEVSLVFFAGLELPKVGNRITSAGAGAGAAREQWF